MPEAGAGSPPPTSGTGTPDPKAGAGSPNPNGGGNEQTFTQAKVQEMVQNAIDETTGRWGKKLDKATREFERQIEELGKKQPQGGDTSAERVTVKQLETNLGLEVTKRETAESKAAKRGDALKRFGLIAELESAKATYPSQVAELLSRDVALDDGDGLFVPDKDGDPKLNTKTGKPYTLAELVAEHKAKFPGMYTDSTRGGAGFSGSGGGTAATLDAQIAEAEAKGDLRAAGILKAKKLKEMPVPSGR